MISDVDLLPYGEWVSRDWRWLNEDRSSVHSVFGTSGVARGSVASSKRCACLHMRVPADAGDLGMTEQDLGVSGSSC